jgi:dGTPase
MQSRDSGGLRLTYATLAAFTKYPTSSLNAGQDQYIGAKKHGFFEDDREYFAKIAKAVGLIRYDKGWRRHPLVFLIEAADDICYRIIDVEDAFKLDRLSFKDAEELLVAFLPSANSYRHKDDDGESINWLRAKAISALIDQVDVMFQEFLPNIMNGTFPCPLLEKISSHAALKDAGAAVARRVFEWERTISAEIAGAQMITDVLERLISAVESPSSYRNEMLLKIVPGYENNLPIYSGILYVTDFLAGMTDSYLQRIHKRVTGQSIH